LPPLLHPSQQQRQPRGGQSRSVALTGAAPARRMSRGPTGPPRLPKISRPRPVDAV
jgi:hypothetical protein